MNLNSIKEYRHLRWKVVGNNLVKFETVLNTAILWKSILENKSIRITYKSIFEFVQEKYLEVFTHNSFKEQLLITENLVFTLFNYEVKRVRMNQYIAVLFSLEYFKSLAIQNKIDIEKEAKNLSKAKQ